MYLFGYGSLMNSESAEETLLRSVSISDLIPAFLHGYNRTWSAKEQVMSEAFGRQITAVFLDINASSDFEVNGVLLKVNQAEMERLKIREKNYDCVDVTASITVSRAVYDPFRKVYTFICKQENRVNSRDRNIYILRQYIEKVEGACAAFGDDFLASYHSTTQKPPFTIIDGAYS